MSPAMLVKITKVDQPPEHYGTAANFTLTKSRLVD